MKKILLPLFFLLCLINLIAEFQGFIVLIFFTKPLLLTVLAVYFFLHSEALPRPLRYYILAGLLWSVAGDTFLMFVENRPGYEHFFLFGLGSFLITHLCYLRGFLSHPQWKKGWVAQRPWLLALFLLYLLGNSLFLWPDLPNSFKLPVLIYSAAIIAMTAAALNLKGLMASPAFTILLMGVLLFVASDSIIALNKFKSAQLSIPYPRLLIMMTYLMGQFLIVRGSLAND